MMDNKYEVLIIGSGPGGYVAGIKAAKLGLKVAIIEKGLVGGTCLNRGCIPAKAMIHGAGLFRETKEAERFGIHAKEVSYDFEEMLNNKEEVSLNLRQGIEKLFASNGVTLISGKAKLIKSRVEELQLDNGHLVQVETGEESILLQGKSVILATGSKPIQLPIPGIQLDHVLTSDDLLQLRNVPQSLVIIGGGVISVEFASVYADLGCEVTIVEALPRIVPNMDKEISQNLKMILKKRGVSIYTGAKVQNIQEQDGQLSCNFIEKDKEISISAEYILSAVGRAPNTDGLFDLNLPIQLERGRITVNSSFETHLKGVYAIGDLIFGAQLAHTASAQGLYVAELLAGEKPSVNTLVVPGCVYLNPEIASVGITEDEAKEQGISVKVGKFMMSANGKSMITKEERGFIKIVAQENSQIILGAQMMCARATDMIGELVTAVANQLTVAQLLLGMRSHPTYNEGVGEALEDCFGQAIHVVPRRK